MSISEEMKCQSDLEARARVAGVLVALALLSPPLHLVGGRAALPFSPDK